MTELEAIQMSKEYKHNLKIIKKEKENENENDILMKVLISYKLLNNNWIRYFNY